MFVSTATGLFLVSARHVFEPLTAGTGRLFFYAGPGVVRNLAGELKFTTPLQGDRDRCDIGVLRLLAPVSTTHPAIDKRAVPLTALRGAALPREQKYYLITGFPASKNKLKVLRRCFEPTFQSVSCWSASPDEYPKIACSPETHIVMQFAPPKTDPFTDPHGMSGGPVWLLFDQAGQNDRAQTPVIGVFTEYHRKHNLLVATDIQSAIALISEF
jgi:hypothetical protein